MEEVLLYQSAKKRDAVYLVRDCTPIDQKRCSSRSEWDAIVCNKSARTGETIVGCSYFFIKMYGISRGNDLEGLYKEQYLVHVRSPKRGKAIEGW